MKVRDKQFESLQAILVALLAALILRQFVIAAYKIPTPSMEETLQVGDFLLVNKFVYGATTPEWVGVPFTRWKDLDFPTGFTLPDWLQFRFPGITDPKPDDVVVFKYPKDPRLEYIKRCIAAGSDTVEIHNKTVYLNGDEFGDPLHAKFTDTDVLPRYSQVFSTFDPSLGSRDNFGPLTVTEGNYFMMGDNRDYSSDSRQWGFVHEEHVVGKPLIIYLSLENDVQDDDSFLHSIRWNRLGLVVR